MSQSMPPALAAAVEAVNKKPGDIAPLLQLGGLAHDYGQHEQAAKIRDHLALLLGDQIRLGQISPDRVKQLLASLYLHFVKKIETEAHARACFQSWLAPITEYGRRLQDPALPVALWQPATQRPWRAAFLLCNSDILGHVEGLLELLAHRPRGLPWHDVPVVYNIGTHSRRLDDLIEATGSQIVNLQFQSPQTDFFALMQSLRRHVGESGVSHFVWVSAPAFAPFALAMRLAPVQVFWTLKFHPFQIPEIDGYITYGAWSENHRVVHGETWDVVPFMVSRPSATVDEAGVAAVRKQFSQHDVLFGTLARTEKLNSAPYLDSVVRILRDNPRAGFLWTGQNHHDGIARHFAAAGVADRCHFIGWVNTPLYARVLDVFLESFPFGCGLTGIQALEAGTAFLSYAAPETQYGMHFLRPLQEGGAAAMEIRALLAPADGSAPLLYPQTVDEYVALANRLARDAAFRKAVGTAGQAYYRRYLTDSDRMGQRFFQVLADCKQPAMKTA